MILLDSNIVIYSALAEFDYLLEFIKDTSPFVSAVSRLEVLGFPGLHSKDTEYFESFFKATSVLPISNKIISEAIRLRKLRKMKLGDSIIAGTASVHKLALATRNTKDFKWIDSLDLIDPFETE